MGDWTEGMARNPRIERRDRELQLPYQQLM